MNKIKEFYVLHKKAVIITIAVILGILAFRTVNIMFFQKNNIETKRLLTDEELEKLDAEEFAGTNKDLMERQSKLEKRYGEAPEGFIWDDGGELLSLGDHTMSGEDVIYVYLQSLSKLDIANAQKYSRKTAVVKRYTEYYSDLRSTDYKEQFDRNIYAEVLKSMQIKSVKSTATLAGNKQIYTVEANVIDLTNKDFWKNERDVVYNALSTYNSQQGDSTKADTYLYDYILGYYRKPNAIRRNITFDITVEKFSDLATNWLVSVDTDLDNACVYKDGRSVISYIKEEYNNYRSGY